MACAWTIRAGWSEVLRLGGLEGPALARGAGQIVLQLAWVLAAVLLVLGLVDYGLRYRRFESMLRTTTQEQREDRRVIEGDPAARAQRRQIARAIARRLARTVDRRQPDTKRCGRIDARSGGRSAAAARHGSDRRQGTRRNCACADPPRRHKIPQVDAPDLARRLARRPSSRSPLAAELIAELAAIWPIA